MSSEAAISYLYSEELEPAANKPGEAGLHSRAVHHRQDYRPADKGQQALHKRSVPNVRAIHYNRGNQDDMRMHHARHALQRPLDQREDKCRNRHHQCSLPIQRHLRTFAH